MVSNPHSYQVAGYTLHAEELADVDLAEGGNSWVAVIGRAWPLSTGIIPMDSPSVADVLLQMLGEAEWVGRIDEALYDLGGRYAVLIYRAGVLTAYTDACGNRSVFYSLTTREVGSHFALVRRGLEDQALASVVGNDHREDLSWERTRSPYIEALLPNHRINMQDGTQFRFYPVRHNRASVLCSDERLELAARLWSEQLERIVGQVAPKVMSITAGFDSRTMLALAQPHMDSFETFTYTSDEAVNHSAPSTYWSKSGANDFGGVQQLRPFLPTGHLIIEVPADRTEDPAQEWAREHVNILARNADRSHNVRLLPRYIEEFPDPRTIHYRGNLFEIGRLHLRSPVGGRREAFDDLLRRLARGASLDEDSVIRSSVAAEARLGYSKVPADYDLTDIFYWEQRHGRWFAQVLNETDAAFDTVTPFNVRRMIDLFLAYSIQDRSRGFAQRELLYRAAPLLTFVGINGDPDLYRRFVSNGRPEQP
ncbi:hypothetical protein [Brachybacterium tyrofermentans]|uniref:hypothetical protein n=1 Tax=Brachybacterium tyrofermentans TaxID=47848 RepID=UPI003FD14E18